MYLPSGSSSEERQQAKFRFLAEFHAAPAGAEAPAARLRALRRLEHRAQGDRPEELALQPEELRLPARGARVARRAVRRRALRRRVPRGEPAARAVHVVVQPRPGLGEERRLAHRLPGAESGIARQRARRRDLQGAALLRPRAAHRSTTTCERTGQRAMPTDVAPAVSPGGAAGSNAVRAYRNPRVLAMLFLGFSAGLPFMLVFSTLSAWLREAGHRARDDRHAVVGRHHLLGEVLLGARRGPAAAAGARTGCSGRRRSWMLVAQVGIAVGLAQHGAHESGRTPRHAWLRSRCSLRSVPRRRTSRWTPGASRRRRR